MIEVLEPGLASSVQDGGRRGLRALGVPLGGAVDAFSLRAANVLVGNPEDSAALEFTLTGPRLRFHADAVIALCGARFEARIEDLALPGWRPIRLAAGTELQLGRAQRGARGYLAVAGGLDLPAVLGSRSALEGSGLPGLCGRRLQAGDVLRLSTHSLTGRHWPRALIGVRMARWWGNPAPVLELDQPAEIGLMPGSYALVDAEALFDAHWTVSARSGRMGLRLDGPDLALAEATPTLSEPVCPGTLQLTPEGGPILLLSEAQTVGGYPRIGHAGLADLPRLAQLAPGERLRFFASTVETARERLQAMDRHLKRLKLAAAKSLSE